MTKHFTIEELTRSDYAIRHGIDNTPSQAVQPNLALLSNGLERVRAILAVPLHVTSGYRCQKLNRAIGGADNSQHMMGLAADFVAPGFGSPRQIAETLADHADYIDFDQLIYEGEWVHISFTQDPRGNVLTATFPGPHYQIGIAA